MKVARIHRNGGPSVLKYEEVDLPKPGKGQFLIEVHFAGVNPVDTKIRQGKFKLFKAKLPAVIGRDISGTVRAVGASAKGGRAAFRVGDPVFGMLDYARGAYAEYTLASEHELARVPKGLGEKEAGVIGVAALTAWQGLFDHGKLKKGQRVLIHGAAGGVGHFAVQFAKYAGATVVATASKGDLAWVKSLGADEVIDFKNQRFEEHTGEIDLVLDLIAGETQDRSWGVLKDSGGVLVSTLTEPSKALARRHKARGMRMVVIANREQLAKIGGLVASGRVKITIAKVFPLRKAADAHTFIEKGHFRGKVALKATPGWSDLEPRLLDAPKTPAERLALLTTATLSGIGPYV